MPRLRPIFYPQFADDDHDGTASGKRYRIEVRARPQQQQPMQQRATATAAYLELTTPPARVAATDNATESQKTESASANASGASLTSVSASGVAVVVAAEQPLVIESLDEAKTGDPQPLSGAANGNLQLAIDSSAAVSSDASAAAPVVSMRLVDLPVSANPLPSPDPLRDAPRASAQAFQLAHPQSLGLSLQLKVSQQVRVSSLHVSASWLCVSIIVLLVSLAAMY